MPYFLHPDGNAAIAYDGVTLERFAGRIWAPADATAHMLSHGFVPYTAQDGTDDPPSEAAGDPVRRAPTPVDPAFMDKDALRAWLTQCGEAPGRRASEEAMRARVRALLTSSTAAQAAANG